MLEDAGEIQALARDVAPELAARLKALNSQEPAATTPDVIAEERRGAGRGGIILASEER